MVRLQRRENLIISFGFRRVHLILLFVHTSLSLFQVLIPTNIPLPLTIPHGCFEELLRQREALSSAI
jgi:hypothetical protein